MKSDKKDLSRLEKILVSAWQRDSDLALSDNWQKGVMDTIRGLPPLSYGEGKNGFFGLLVWRFSAAAVACALLLIGYLLLSGFVPYQDLAALYLDDPLGFIFSTPFA